jgi:hypothetical protein
MSFNRRYCRETEIRPDVWKYEVSTGKGQGFWRLGTEF